MTATLSIGHFLGNASLPVQLVVLLLLGASIVSWMLIFQRAAFLRAAHQSLSRFNDQFGSGQALSDLYGTLDRRCGSLVGLEKVFYAGFQEFTQLCAHAVIPVEEVVAGAQRAMRAAEIAAIDRLEQHLAFLATVGATAPYIGLFGTVWGIMHAFRALGDLQNTTITAVAPGISEALMTTALGLFVAIPAVIAYNRYVHRVSHFVSQYQVFQENFSSVLYREWYAMHKDV